MAKRTVHEAEDAEMEDNDIVNVDFDFFDFIEDDFLSIKNLLRQLLSLDNTKFDISAITRAIIDGKQGSTVKADDEEYNDVLAFISLVKLGQCEELRSLISYWTEQTTSNDNAAVNRVLRQIVHEKKNIGIIFSERLLNMPFEVVPPLYQLLSQEVEANTDNLDYVIIPSRMYSEQEPAEDLKTETKKQAAKRGPASNDMYPFHPEDDALKQLAVASGSFSLETPITETESRRAFQEYGIYPYGYLTVLDFKKLAKVNEALSELFS